MKFKKLLILLLGVAPLLPYSASALVMRENGPEPIIVQVKESFRLSDELDNRLNELESTRSQNGLHVQKWWAGRKLLVMFSFPSNFTERQALTVIGRLQQLTMVEKVVAVSAFNLEFTPAELAREYAPNQTIPEAARRGLDRDESRPAIAQVNIDEAVRMPHAPNQIIVRWKSQHVWRATEAGFLRDIADFHVSAGAYVLHEMKPSPTDLIQVIEFTEPSTSLAEKLRRYADCPWVDYAQPNYVYSRSANTTPDDTFYTNPGQPNLPKIKAPNAWNTETGDHDVVIAVVDGGANINHPDFENRLSPGWHNFATNPANDNDDVTDTETFIWHGSNVASIIGAEGNNGSGDCPGPNCGYMAGVAWDVRLLILKTPTSGDSVTYARAIDYAYTSNQGHDPAIAVNCSFAFGPASSVDPTLAGAVGRARSNNMVVVAAAANRSLDSDVSTNLFSPASIPKDNVISVGATRVRPGNPLDDTKPDFSNYGKYRVELGAPGGEDPPDDDTFGILGLTQLSGDPQHVYNRMSGTSQAAPHVAGALALVKSKYPWENYAGIRDRVIMGTDDVAALSDKFRTGGRLNLSKALQKRTLIRNLSTRAKVESGDRIIIGGFTIGGSASGPCGPAPLPPCLKVAIRGLGPSLPPLGVPRLSNPKLQLNNSAGQPIFLNGDWGSLPQDQQTDLANAGLTPGYAQEAAMVQTLPPGSYTVLLQSQALQQGVALLEIWELSGNTNEQVRLTNISTRCPVGVGDEVPIAGTILGDPNGSSDVPKRRLLMLGRGPSLEKLGVPDVLADPQIELHGPTGALIESNDQWQDVDGPSTSTGLEDKLNDSGFAPTDENESVLWPTLVRGAYTTILQGVNDGTGIGLIEFYEY